MEYNYSKEIRKTFKIYIDNNKKINSIYSAERSVEEIDILVKLAFCQFISQNYFSGNATEIFTNSVIIRNELFAIQLFTDLYKEMAYLSAIGQLDDSGNKTFSFLRQINSLDEIMKIVGDSKYISELCSATLKFNDLAVYDKILRIKALSNEDRNLLASLNPFFEIECLNYDVLIDHKFLIRQIGKWQKQFSDDIDKSYIDATNFLLSLRKIDAGITDILLESLIKDFGEEKSNDVEFSDIVKNVLVNLYENYKDSVEKKLIK